jgi:hypothetical protein
MRTRAYVPVPYTHVTEGVTSLSLRSSSHYLKIFHTYNNASLEHAYFTSECESRNDYIKGEAKHLLNGAR